MSIAFEKYLNIRMAYAPSFAPDGQRVAFVSNLTGVPQAWAMDVRGGWPDQLTFAADRVVGVWYSPVDDRLVFARDLGGNENAQLVLLNGDGSDERPLTDDPGAMHIFGDWSPDGTRIAFSANRRDRGRYDLYVMHVDSRQEQVVWHNDQPGFVWPVAFSPDGTRLLVQFLHSSMRQELYEICPADGSVRRLTQPESEMRCHWPVYAADGGSVYCVCDHGRDLAAVMRLDLTDLSLQAVAAPPGEVEGLARSTDGRRLVWWVNHDGAHQLHLHDTLTGHTRPAPGLPTGVVAELAPALSAAPLVLHHHQAAFTFSTSTRTPDIWHWDLELDSLAPITRSSHAGIPTAALVEPELIHYPTFDGRRIPAWYYRPANGGSLPVVVYVHGGPEGQTQPMLFPILQYFLHHGYAVLAPNVRGSSGYGRAYLDLDNVGKRMDSVADLAHAAYWLRGRPEVDPARLAVYGGSYGGFMVLSALTTYPDLWAAGVDIVGISSFVTFLENTSAYRRSMREAEYGSLARDRELLERISPIHHLDQIRAPLMVIHGANDPRVPLSEAEQMVRALEARGVPVEFLVYPDEGHGLVKLANKLDAYPRVAAFLDRHLAPHP